MQIEYDFGDYEVEDCDVVNDCLWAFETKTLVELLEDDIDWKTLAQYLDGDPLDVPEKLREQDRDDLERIVKSECDEKELAISLYDTAYDFYYERARDELTSPSDLEVNGWGEI